MVDSAIRKYAVQLCISDITQVPIKSDNERILLCLLYHGTVTIDSGICLSSVNTGNLSYGPKQKKET